MDCDHPLDRIDGLELGEYRLLFAELNPLRVKECTGFKLILEDKAGIKSTTWVIKGLFNSGRGPIKPWVDISYRDQIGFPLDQMVSLYQEGLSPALFQALGTLVPPGGHLMVSYDEGDPIHRITERALALNFPPCVTPLGYLLIQAGFLSLRDWYWPEGGSEGPRKIWSERPLNLQVAVGWRQRIAEEVKGFLNGASQKDHGEIGQTCSEIARFFKHRKWAEVPA